VRILFVAANPLATDRLRIHRELREIQDRLRGSKHGASIEIVSTPAAQPKDLRRALLELEPHIVHFSGHGSRTEELSFEDERGREVPVSKEALVGLFATLKDRIRAVVLNACHSRPQAEAITQHVDFAVGMSRAVGDDEAIEFATAFYEALAFGRSVQVAFDLGKNASLLRSARADQTPELLVRDGMDARDITLLDAETPDLVPDPPAPPPEASPPPRPARPPSVWRNALPPLLATALGVALLLGSRGRPGTNVTGASASPAASPAAPPETSPPPTPPSAAALSKPTEPPIRRPPTRPAEPTERVPHGPPPGTSTPKDYATSGSARCVKQRCTLSLGDRALDPSLQRVCLDAPESSAALAGGVPTCTLSGSGSIACTRSDKLATVDLEGPITWRPCR
jgi:hypothetical protein